MDHILSVASAAGKTTAMGASNAEQAAHYAQLGVRTLFAGVDVNLKRRAFNEAFKAVKPTPSPAVSGKPARLGVNGL